MEKQVRVRFAPSPTGPLHIGGVRTALYNYLYARQNNGKFILRIEDTDQNRYVKNAEDYINESLSWCNLNPDEGVIQGGSYGPYRQSERKEIYKQYAEQLVFNGFAYYAFDTPEELDEMRNKLKQDNQDIQQYNAQTRHLMKNSFTLSSQETDKLTSEGKPYVIRLKLPDDEAVNFTDVVFGEISFHSSQLDDKILFKSDGMPTYHLANVVDDHLMKISHVIRGSEWINSTPVHILLYKYFGWEKELPVFSHMPLTLKPSGKGKLSKRDGDKMGFPVFPISWKSPETGEISAGYRESGYFPEAFINILALLGWNPGTEKELFTMDELIESFSLERIQKSGSRFDPEKARWFNHQYLILKPSKELLGPFRKVLNEKGISADDEYILKVIDLVKERADFVNELWDHSDFFFIAPDEYDHKVIKKRWTEESPSILNDIITILDSLKNFSEPLIEDAVKSYIKKNQYGFGKVLNILRLTLVGSVKGPELFKIIEMLGKDETKRRIQNAIERINKQQ